LRSNAPLQQLKAANVTATLFASVAAEAVVNSFDVGDSEKALDDILRQCQIVRAVYWSGGLTGRDC
jgi:hypothetical protein